MESGFVMLEKGESELPDMKSFLDVFVSGLKEEKKIYGDVLTRMVIKYVQRAVTKLTGESPVEEIRTLDDAAAYLLSKSGRIRPDYIIIWAHFVTVNKLEGALGVGEHMLDMGISKYVIDKMGNQLVGLDVDSVISAAREIMLKIKIAPIEMGYRKNDDGSVDLAYRNCYLHDGCRMSLEKGLSKRADGRMVCGFSACICKLFEKASGEKWDYTVTFFEKPLCIVRCFKV
ncbi:MAG: hypothetical protein QXK94_03100 [Candidatus Jordarchaeales archaeon]